MRKRCGAAFIAALAVASILLVSPADAADLFGTNGRNTIRGGGGNDVIFGKGGADKLVGDGGNDRIFGGAGQDIIHGGAGADLLYDDDSRKGDRLKGSSGNDILYSLDGKPDRVNCGSGTDIAFVDRKDDVRGCETKVRRERRVDGSLVAIGSNGADLFDLGDADDIVFGRAGSDTIAAGSGDDIILGGGSGDSIQGEDDEDVIVDDDGNRGELISPGDGNDVVYAADGASTSIDCSDDDDDGDNDVVFIDIGDTAVDCGTVIRG